MRSLCAVLFLSSASCGNTVFLGSEASPTADAAAANVDSSTGVTPADAASDEAEVFTTTDPAAAVQVSVGYLHACIRTAGGSVRCWGYGGGGEVGPDAKDVIAGEPGAFEPTPPLPGLPAVRQVMAGHYMSCAVGTDDKLYCWGHQQRGVRADGVLPAKGLSIWVPEVIAGAGPTREVQGGGDYLVARGVDDQLRTWGFNLYGLLGRETTTPCGGTDSATCSATPASVGSYEGYSSTGSHTCVIAAGGTVQCWGANGYAQLGDGTTVSRWEMKPVVGLAPVREIATGLNGSCARTHAGQVWCWGARSSTVIEPTPKLVVGFGGPVAKMAGGMSPCVVLASGRVQCWGDNSLGQLGTHVAGNYSEKPVYVDDLDDVVDVSVGSFTACAVRRDGSVWCWGEVFWGGILPHPYKVY